MALLALVSRSCFSRLKPLLLWPSETTVDIECDDLSHALVLQLEG
jgi:hypothetical protein